MSAFVGLPIGVRIAIALGLTGSAWTSGANLSCFYISAKSLTDPLASEAVPRGYASRMWQSIYGRGSKMMPPVAAGSSLAFAYAAYFLPANVLNSQHNRQVFFICSFLAASTFPYWLIVMVPTINALHENAAAPAKEMNDLIGTVSRVDEERTKELINRWAWLHSMKGVALLAATGLGFSIILF
ncbi:hypothetical protein GYMLUDRAFT_241944 [Collybiopsis luxurians FD-317 M1]|uniref:DUF1772-domain-containing protein n=1 Tax=Collybiopsis luxurians FD-317 M1 TaxID=944289 RepID=A0A0D0CKP6_9AGAR|nr:hypothetical protein GYMLUDRAFT_241944 [Collybiopsis luxurians FD-317 M1]